MGLDMYAYKRMNAPASGVDFKEKEGDELFFNWRKHPNLHGWMQNLYTSKGGRNPKFNLATVVLTSDDLNDLERDVRMGRLPHTVGFFFGESRPEDAKDDLQFITEARSVIASGHSVFYTSWW